MTPRSSTSTCTVQPPGVAAAERGGAARHQRPVPRHQLVQLPRRGGGAMAQAGVLGQGGTARYKFINDTFTLGIGGMRKGLSSLQF